MIFNKELIEKHLEHILANGLDLDLQDPNLIDTPRRIAKMYVEDLFWGLYTEPPKITVFPNTDNYDEIILVDNIPFVSVCSHHFLPFQGLAYFLYIPNKLIEDSNLSGASKMPRVVQYWAARPQLQERLTQQSVDYFESVVKPLGTMLVMRAVHGCMACRGVRTGNGTGMMTSKVTGCFKEDSSTKMEALSLINMSIKLSAR